HMILSACGGSSGSTGGNTPVHGGTVIDALSQEPNNMLPQRSNQTFSALVQATFRSPLFASNDQAGTSAILAKEVPSIANGDISADGKTITIHMRTDTKWSDNQPVTADDVVYTLKLFSDPAYNARNGFKQAATEISDISMVDPGTVKITLNQVDSAFIALYLTDSLAFAPLPKHVYGSMAPADLTASQESFKPTVTNGAFKVASRVQGDNITIVKDPN